MQEIKILEGNLMAGGQCFGIIAAQFNKFISSKLRGGVINTIIRYRSAVKDILLAWVPYTYEVPLAVQKMAAGNNYDMIICLGAVNRGSMSHFDGLCAYEVAKSIASVGRSLGMPIIFGVLTTESIKQAVERTSAKSGNKGFDAVVAAIEIANIRQKLDFI